MFFDLDLLKILMNFGMLSFVNALFSYLTSQIIFVKVMLC